MSAYVHTRTQIRRSGIKHNNFDIDVLGISQLSIVILQTFAICFVL